MGTEHTKADDLSYMSTGRKTLLLVTLITIIFTRLGLFLMWNSGVMTPFLDDNWHHIYTGAILMLASIFIPQKYAKVIFGLGLGLFLDELIHLFHLLGLTDEVGYWSSTAILATLLGTLTVALLLFYFPYGHRVTHKSSRNLIQFPHEQSPDRHPPFSSPS